jgi:hypothetical protein
MELHFIYNPNRWLYHASAGSAEVRVHRAGCRDIAKERKGSTSDYASAHASQEEAAQDWWADFIAEESMTADDAMQYTDFMPCTAGLPVSSPQASQPNPTADKLAAQHNRTAYRIAELQEKLEWLKNKERTQYAAAMAALHDGQQMRHGKEAVYGASQISVVY